MRGASVALVALLAGCSVPTALLTDVLLVERPGEAGVWEGSVETPDGTSRPLRVSLVASEQVLADGSRVEAPVLRLELGDAGSGSRVANILAPSGTWGVRGRDLVLRSGILGETPYEMDRVVFMRNLSAGEPPTWFELGPALWDVPLRRGPATPALVTTGEMVDAPATIGLEKREDECEVVVFEVAERSARAAFCGEPVPSRIAYADGTIVTLARSERGGPLPPVAPAPLARAATPVEGAPADGSDLPLTLEEAVAIARADPRAGAWLAARAEAVAVAGILAEVGCATAEEATCPTREVALASGWEWRLNWSSSEGGAQMVVAKVGAIGRVASFETSAAASAPLAHEAVPLADALALWRAFVDERFRLVRVSYDLSAQAPRWTFDARVAPSEGVEVGGFVIVSFSVSMASGLVEDGWASLAQEE